MLGPRPPEVDSDSPLRHLPPTSSAVSRSGVHSHLHSSVSAGSRAGVCCHPISTAATSAPFKLNDTTTDFNVLIGQRRVPFVLSVFTSRCLRRARFVFLHISLVLIPLSGKMVESVYCALAPCARPEVV